MISISSTNLAQDREKVHVLKPSIKRSPSLPTNLAQDRERKHEKDKPKGVPLKARKFAKSDYEPLLSDNEETDDIRYINLSQHLSKINVERSYDS